MAGSIRAFAMGAAFSLVAAGFAYAVPRAILTTAEKAIVEKAPIVVAEPVVEDTEEIEIEPINGGRKRGQDGETGARGNGEKDNHGAAVSTAARCDVRGRAQGELASSIAKDKDATVEDARAACEAARARQQSPRVTGSKANENRSQSNAQQSSKGKGGAKNQSSPESANGDTPGSANDGVKSTNGSPDSTTEAPGSADSEEKTGPRKSGSATKGSKSKGAAKNQSTSGVATDDDPDDSEDEETAGGGPPAGHPGEAASTAHGKPQV